jgi:hypothetical protein
MDKIWGKSIMIAKSRYRCNNKCKFFEDTPGQLQPQKVQAGDWIGWCHLRSGNLLILNSTYDLICYFGCASHSDFQIERERVLDEAIKKLQTILEDPNKSLPWKIAPLSQTIALLNDLKADIRQAGEP